MKVLELFCGTKSIGKEFKKKGHEVISVDIDKQFKPDIVKDIMELTLKDIPKNINVIWASPPCNSFSVASIYRHWKNGNPKSEGAILGRAMLYKTLWIIDKIKPKYFFIENPRGMMRKDGLLQYLTSTKIKRNTVTYCQYGAKVQKPTDIWTNNINWIPKPMCKPGSNCHESARRGEDKGTQNQNRNPILRAIIPPELCKEIVTACEVGFDE